MDKSEPLSRQSSFDGEVHASRSEIEDAGDEAEPRISSVEEQTTGSSASVSRSPPAMDDVVNPTSAAGDSIRALILRAFPGFEFSVATKCAERKVEELTPLSLQANNAIHESIRTAWEASDMKTRFDQSVKNVSIR